MPASVVTPRSHSERRWAARRQAAMGGTGMRPLPQALMTPRGANAPMPAGQPQTQFSADPNAIVTVQVQTIQAPTPNTYQQTGCFVSFGATTLANQDCAELAQYSDISDILIQPQPVATMTWSAGLITCTTAAPIIPAYTAGDTPQMTIAGFTPTAYNYTGPVTIVDTGTFTYPATADPGPPSVTGTFQPQGAVELSQMVTTYFSQGNMVSVWVLELGSSGQIATNASALQTWLNVNPRTFCGYLLPRICGNSSVNIQAFEAIFKQYENPEAMTYFWLTVGATLTHVLDITYKCVIQMVEAPSVIDNTQPNVGNPNGEFSMAAMFYNAMAFRPSQINRVAPMAFKYLYGVTAYPTKNNAPLLLQFKADFTNYVATGAEGGISYDIVYQGVTRDGNDYFNWWWTIDWVQINLQLNLSNAIINGSNNPFAPLYYNQDGINFLLTNVFQTMVQASTFGMVLGTIIQTAFNQPDLQNNILLGLYEGMCDCNAVSFIDYVNANPGHYKIGEYDGLSVLFIPARGFIHVLVNVTASSLVSI